MPTTNKPSAPLPILHAFKPELSHLGFQRVLPNPALLPWVQCYWWLDFPGVEGEGYQEKLYPDGGCSLTFQLQDAEAEGAFFHVAQRIHFKPFRERTRTVGVRFMPGGAFHLLQMALGELDQPRYSAADFASVPEQRLWQQLRECTTPAACFAMLDDWLLQRLAHSGAAASWVQQALPRLLELVTPVHAVIADVPGSRRAFERHFRLETGCTPAQLRILLRVRQARYLIKTRPDLSLTEIAQHCGYFDQAHFIRQFSRITGQSPGQYQRRKHPPLA